MISFDRGSFIQPGTIGSKKLKDFERFKGEKIKIKTDHLLKKEEILMGFCKG